MRVNVLIDSFGWIEYFSDGSLADKFGKYIEKANRDEYFTPAIVIYEVYKQIKKGLSEEKALEVYAYISAYTKVVPVDEKIALEAAELSLEHNLHMADSFIAATAKVFDAKIITGDLHFKSLKNAELIQ
jgi:predicted nucleic acid-binding protein